MSDSIRKQLEQLMGSGTLYGDTGAAPKHNLEDPGVCRAFIYGHCPHDIVCAWSGRSNANRTNGNRQFTNTKGDIGPCPRIHSEALKAEYEALDQEKKDALQFDYDTFVAIRPHIEKCNHNVKMGNAQLEPTGEEVNTLLRLTKEIDDLTESNRIAETEIKILFDNNQVLIAYQEAHKLATNINERLIKEAELKKLKENTGASGHQKLLVCDICAAFLSRLDNDKRLADHFYGKVHLGFRQLREVYEELSNKWKGRAPPVRSFDRAQFPSQSNGYPQGSGGGYFGGGGGRRGGGGGGGGYGGGYGGGGGGGRGRGGRRGGGRHW